MDLTRVARAVGIGGIGKLFIPQVFKDLLKENAETHKKLGEIPLLKDLENKNVTREQYLAALERMYGLYAALEPTLERITDWKQIGINFDERRRLPLFEKDFQQFGISGDKLSDIPVCKESIELKTLSEILGFMAVVEGSTAGATATAEKLALSNLHLGPENGAAFFNNYGDRRSEMRMSFSRAVTACQVNSEEFLNGGKKAFDAFYNWLSL